MPTEQDELNESVESMLAEFPEYERSLQFFVDAISEALPGDNRVTGALEQIRRSNADFKVAVEADMKELSRKMRPKRKP